MNMSSIPAVCAKCETPTRRFSTAQRAHQILCPDCQGKLSGKNVYSRKTMSIQELENRLSGIERDLQSMKDAQEIAISGLKYEMLQLLEGYIEKADLKIVKPLLDEVDSRFMSRFVTVNNRTKVNTQLIHMLVEDLQDNIPVQRRRKYDEQ